MGENCFKYNMGDRRSDFSEETHFKILWHYFRSIFRLLKFFAKLLVIMLLLGSYFQLIENPYIFIVLLIIKASRTYKHIIFIPIS